MVDAGLTDAVDRGFKVAVARTDEIRAIDCLVD
jgi:hypothetical protein